MWQQVWGWNRARQSVLKIAVLPFDRKSSKCLWFCSVRHRVGARTPTLRMAKQ
jgi:hypothetical protein